MPGKTMKVVEGLWTFILKARMWTGLNRVRFDGVVGSSTVLGGCNGRNLTNEELS